MTDDLLGLQEAIIYVLLGISILFVVIISLVMMVKPFLNKEDQTIVYLRNPDKEKKRKQNNKSNLEKNSEVKKNR